MLTGSTSLGAILSGCVLVLACSISENYKRPAFTIPGPSGASPQSELAICELAVRTALASKTADTTSTIWKSPQYRGRWPSATPVAFRCDLDEAQSAKLLERLADLPIKLLYGCCWKVVRE